MDGEDPLEVSKAIEVIFLRPGWNEEGSELTQYDKLLMKYYQGQFKYNNVLEIAGYTAFMQNRLEELMTAAEDIQKQIESADDSPYSTPLQSAAPTPPYPPFLRRK